MHFPEKYAHIARYVAFTILFSLSHVLLLSSMNASRVCSTASEAIQFIGLIDELATNIAVERGLTEGVLGVSSVGAQALQLTEQRLKTSQSEQNLRDFTPEYIDAAFVKKVLNTFWAKLGQGKWCTVQWMPCSVMRCHLSVIPV